MLRLLRLIMAAVSDSAGPFTYLLTRTLEIVKKNLTIFDLRKNCDMIAKFWHRIRADRISAENKYKAYQTLFEWLCYEWRRIVASDTQAFESAIRGHRSRQYLISIGQCYMLQFETQ